MEAVASPADALRYSGEREDCWVLRKKRWLETGGAVFGGIGEDWLARERFDGYRSVGLLLEGALVVVRVDMGAVVGLSPRQHRLPLRFMAASHIYELQDYRTRSLYY